MKELTKEVLFAYAAYELDVSCAIHHGSHREKATYELNPKLLYEWLTDKPKFEQFKPFLYGLDMLTKPIEHGGETFVPMLELYCIAEGFNDPDIDQFDFRQLSNGGFYGDVYSCSRLLSNKQPCLTFSPRRGFYLFQDFGDMSTMVKCESQIKLFQKLHEWHFNVYDLHPSLWVDKNSLKTKNDV